MIVPRHTIAPPPLPMSPLLPAGIGFYLGPGSSAIFDNMVFEAECETSLTARYMFQGSQALLTCKPNFYVRSCGPDARGARRLKLCLCAASCIASRACGRVPADHWQHDPDLPPQRPVGLVAGVPVPATSSCPRDRRNSRVLQERQLRDASHRVPGKQRADHHVLDCRAVAAGVPVQQHAHIVRYRGQRSWTAAAAHCAAGMPRYVRNLLPALFACCLPSSPAA